MTTYHQEAVYVFTSLACASIGAVFDIRYRKIPNFLTGPSILLALMLHLSLGGWAQLGYSALAGLIAGAVFLIFFVAGGLGGGDVKLMTAVGCLVGISYLGQVLLATMIAGAVLAIVLAIYRGRLRETLGNVMTLVVHHRHQGLRPHPELNVTNAKTLRLPYALPIAAGCLSVVWALVMKGHQ